MKRHKVKVHHSHSATNNKMQRRFESQTQQKCSPWASPAHTDFDLMSKQPHTAQVCRC